MNEVNDKYLLIKREFFEMPPGMQRDVLFEILEDHYVGDSDNLWEDIMITMEGYGSTNAFPDVLEEDL